MALYPPIETLPPSPLDEDEDEDLPFPPVPPSPPPSPPRAHASSTNTTTTATSKPFLSAPHIVLLVVPLVLGLLLFCSMQRLPPTSSPLDIIEPFLLLLLLLPLVLCLLNTLSSFTSSLVAPPRLSKAEKKAIKYAYAKQRLRYTRQKYHRKKSQIYKELTEEEQAEVNARMVARKEERKERFTALLAVDAGWLKKRKESRRMKREAREMAKREEEGGMDKEGGSDDDSSSIPPSLPPHLRLALDIHYGESIHGLRGTRSLTQQVGWCYHSLKRASSFHNTPIFHITSFQGLTAEMLKGSGAHNWPIYRHEEELLAVFPRQSIIYLSPDAEDVLMGPLDLSKVYAIGGIVDRTVVRGISQEVATRWQIKSARLPLEYLNLKSKQATAALNVDTVVKVMMAVHANGGDWLMALEECLPKRKSVEKSKGELKRQKREREEKGKEEEEGEEEEEEEEKAS